MTPNSRDFTSRLQDIAEAARARLDATHAAREKALPAARLAVQLSARSIRAAHRGEMDAAADLARQAREAIAPAGDALKEFPDIYQAGFLQDAEKEVAEAHITLAMISRGTLPTPSDVGVSEASYLKGLAEAASEMRRAALDALRRDDVEGADGLLAMMDEAYSLLITFDYPDAVTHGLRRTTDQLRGVLERTRGDVTMSMRQMSLERRLADFERGKPPA
ncbi:MAG: haloacid dehalogenase [Dehalococcoidia bacterium]